MKRIAFAVIFAALSTVASAQSFVTVPPGSKLEAWTLRAQFHPQHTEVRGIPVARIRPDWCKATEYRRELFPKELLIENGTDVMAYSHQSFALTGQFDRSNTRQVALVGVYQTCAGGKGSFLLIIDEDTRKVRFVDAIPSKAQYAALSLAPRNTIALFHCMECHDSGLLRWDPRKKSFAWVKGRRGY
jgi:hypothetical protein